MGKFCDIQTRNELADFLKIPRSKLTHLLYVEGTAAHYEIFEVPKKSGGARVICAPSKTLKSIQRKLADVLYEYRETVWRERGIRPSISHGFEKDKSIITNAAAHRNKQFVLNLDLEDFFPSFHFGRVAGFFEKNRDFQMPHEAAVTIAQIACCEGKLPQGAPTSPVIANLICQVLDMRLLETVKKYKLDYTRYADDLTFSTNDQAFLNHYAAFMEEAAAKIQSAGFSVNSKKTRLRFRDSRQEVTGLIVNRKVNVSRDYYKETKAMAHRLYTKGGFEVNGVPGTMRQLEGRFSFIDQLDHYNNKLDSEIHRASTLNGRERQYQAFLFYKYFFANENPLVITEGKTDILYLKAALKALHSEYPKLVERDADGYKFKISFLRRSKRWQYYFDVSLDGADTLRNLYWYFVQGRKMPNYLDYFRTISKSEPKNPVIFLFDHETESERPLKKFLKDLKPGDKDRLKADLLLRLTPKGNLYLLTNPLVSGKSECEIEDMFTEETLGHKIDGKSFSLSDQFDKKSFYGKNDFSKYVFANYDKIDFSGFRGLLDKLDSIVQPSLEGAD